MKKLYLLFFLLLQGVFISKAQTFDRNLAAKLQNTLDSIRRAENIQGISACVFYPGQGYWKGVSGESYAGVPITTDMRFHIASNTKTFTAVLLLKLVENGMVDLDDHVSKWLPDYNDNIDPDISIRQLLNHTSGVANTFDIPGWTNILRKDWNRIIKPEEILMRLPAPKFRPGKGQYYSNANYHLAGLIIENVSHRHLEQIMRDSIFSPLGLDNTYFPVYDTIQGVIAHPWQYGIDKSGTPRTSLISAMWAAGAIYATASDLAKWYNTIFNGHFLKPDIYKEMINFTGPQRWGFGIKKLKINGNIVWGHGGNTIGYGSAVIYDPASHTVIAVLLNDNSHQQFAIIKALFSIIKKIHSN